MRLYPNELTDETLDINEARFLKDDQDDDQRGDPADHEEPNVYKSLHRVDAEEEFLFDHLLFHNPANEEGGEEGGDGHHPARCDVVHRVEKVLAVDLFPVRE